MSQMRHLLRARVATTDERTPVKAAATAIGSRIIEKASCEKECVASPIKDRMDFLCSLKERIGFLSSAELSVLDPWRVVHKCDGAGDFGFLGRCIPLRLNSSIDLYLQAVA